MIGRLKKGQTYPHKESCLCFRCTGIPSKNRKFHYGKNHHNWKGDKAGYLAIHTWIQRKLGNLRKCDDCGTEVAKKYEWANISGEYKRDVSDFKRLCVSCHRHFDYRLGRLEAPKTAFKKGTVPWNKGKKLPSLTFEQRKNISEIMKAKREMEEEHD